MDISKVKFRVAIRYLDGTCKRFPVKMLEWKNEELFVKYPIREPVEISAGIWDTLVATVKVDGTRIVLEPCSGLPDKHGELIFAGHIINDHCCFPWQSNTGEVFFDQKRAKFRIRWISGREDLIGTKTDLSEWLDLHFGKFIAAEITGNINEENQND